MVHARQDDPRQKQTNNKSKGYLRGLHRSRFNDHLDLVLGPGQQLDGPGLSESGTVGFEVHRGVVGKHLQGDPDFDELRDVGHVSINLLLLAGSGGIGGCGSQVSLSSGRRSSAVREEVHSRAHRPGNCAALCAVIPSDLPCSPAGLIPTNALSLCGNPSLPHTTLLPALPTHLLSHCLHFYSAF